MIVASLARGVTRVLDRSPTFDPIITAVWAPRGARQLRWHREKRLLWHWRGTGDEDYYLNRQVNGADEIAAARLHCSRRS